MSQESSLLIQEYYKSNQFQREMENFTVMKKIGNTVCGDTIQVFLKIEHDTITDYSYSGEPSQITKAAAEFFGEYVIGMKIGEVLTLDANWVRAEGFEVSHRRIRSSISAILATRNAIHEYLDDGCIDEYEDLMS
ncbi:hypothetical protein XF24_00938 [candidate division SR1 bacterium Aalborg_AAW-1]|nr:hypothetical protein XF24_00938 [candidate division SR1 bacterium Aalborg_AAW-1]